MRTTRLDYHSDPSNFFFAGSQVWRSKPTDTANSSVHDSTMRMKSLPSSNEPEDMCFIRSKLCPFVEKKKRNIINTLQYHSKNSKLVKLENVAHHKSAWHISFLIFGVCLQFEFNFIILVRGIVTIVLSPKTHRKTLSERSF